MPTSKSDGVSHQDFWGSSPVVLLLILAPSSIPYLFDIPYLLEGVGGVEGLYGLRKIWERLMPRVLDYVICNEIRSHISLRLDTAAA